MYRADIGEIALVWGENDKATNRGFGLKHIIEKHEKSINSLGFKIEDFIPIIVQFGAFNLKKSDSQKKVFEGNNFRFVVAIDKEKSVNWLLTAFDVIKKPAKKAGKIRNL